MRKIYYCIVLLLIGITNVNSQYQKEIDSLQKKLPLAVKDTNRANLLAQLAFYYSFNDSTNTFKYADEATQLATALQFKPAIANALRSKANFFITKRIPQKALPYIQQEAQILQVLKRRAAIAANYMMTGQANTMLGKLDDAQNDLKKAEEIYLQLNNQKALGVLYHTAGNIFTDKNEPERAIDYFLQSLKIQETTNDTRTVGATYNNLGRLFFQTKNFSKAIEYYTKSVAANTAVQDWRNLGITHINIANIYVEQPNLDKAIEELNKALARFIQVDFKRGMQVCYNNLGAIQLRKGNYETAIPLLKKGLELAKENQTQAGVALIEQNIGYGYTYLKQFDEALKWFTQAENTANKNGADEYTYGEIYNHRASLDSLMGNYNGALVYRTKYMNINEKSTGAKVIRQVNELQTKYETEKKEYKINLLSKSDSIKSLAIVNQQLAINKNLYLIAQQDLALSDAELQLISDSLLLSNQNKRLLQAKLDSSIKEDQIKLLNTQNRINQLEVTRKNNQIAIALISMALLLLTGYLLYRRTKVKQEQAYQQQLMQQQQKATVDIITAEEKERKRIASDLHDGVGQLMSAAWMNLQALTNQFTDSNSEEAQLLQKSLALVDESCKEVRQVSHNMMPNALLLKGLVNAVKEFIGHIDHRSLNINLQAEGLNIAMPSHIETVLYRVIQESVNNVIKHAGASELDISIIRSGDGIDVMIEDNGKGFNPNQLPDTAGIGLQNIRSRIQYLQGTVEWNTGEGKGTLVAIFIPLSIPNNSVA